VASNVADDLSVHGPIEGSADDPHADPVGDCSDGTIRW